jgi:MSHA biogenesis protein MshO
MPYPKDSFEFRVSSFELEEQADPRSSFNWKLETGNWKLRKARGFTLVEMVVVIAITGILAAAVAVFIRRPVESYVDAARRAELTDIADTALRRITRDLRTALPNSIRIDVTGRYIEFLQTSGGGRYRAAAPGDFLDFTAADATFDVLGTGITIPATGAPGGNQIVVYNLGVPGADAYEGNTAATHVRRAYAGATGINVTNISITSANRLPFESPGKRFQVVSTPVTYHCDLGTGVLRRHWDYAITAAQSAPPADGSNALLATNVTGCSFVYTASGTSARTGILALTLEVSQGGETVRLFQQAHVSNVP